MGWSTLFKWVGSWSVVAAATRRRGGGRRRAKVCGGEEGEGGKRRGRTHGQTRLGEEPRREHSCVNVCNRNCLCLLITRMCIKICLSSLNNLLGEQNIGKLSRHYYKFVKCYRAIVSFVALSNDCFSLAGYFGFCFGTMVGS